MKIFLGIVAAIVVVLGALALYASTKPDSFRIARTAVVGAPPEKVFGMINDLRRFNVWNPYERKDPGKGRHSGPEAGPGAAYSWDSPTIGTGTMTIKESAAPGRVTMDLKFEKPFAAQNVATFTIVPEGAGSRVTWAMEGPMPFLSKAIDMVMGLDRMIGKDFEQGLANLKAEAEKP